jgi:LysR family transcriptional regulator for metE and metH
VNLHSQDLALVDNIAAAGSLTAASRRMHVTQSAVSQRLASLQARLGVTLFERSGGRLRLTRAGDRVLASARIVGAELQAVAADLKSLVDERDGQLRIGTQCYTCYRWLPFVVRDMREIHPHLTVDVVPEATDSPYASLLEDRLDVALVSNPDRDSTLAEYPLFDDELFAVMSATHPLAREPYLLPDQFADETLILYTGNKHAIVEEVLAPAGVSPGRIIQVRITEAIVELARAGQGIAVIAGWAFDDLPDTRDLVVVRITASGFLRTWRAVVNERCNRQHVESLLQCVKSVGNAIGEPAWRSVLRAGSAA